MTTEVMQVLCQLELMQRILQHTGLAILLFNPTGQCVFASQAALALFGADQPQDVRHPASPDLAPRLQADGCPSSEAWDERVKQVRTQGSLMFEWELRHPDGRPLFTRINLTHMDQGGLLHCMVDDISDFKLEQARLEFLAYHDALTSLPNHHSAVEQLRRLLYQQDPPTGVGVISLKLNGFRKFNDAYGHSMGDRLLRQAAMELSCLLPTQFTLYRITGPEYLLMVTGVKSHDELMASCELVSELGGQMLKIEDIDVHLEFRLGASLAPQDGDDPEKLWRQASMACENARRDKTGRFCLYEARMSEELLCFVQIGQALRQALEQHQFELYYQPQIDLGSGRVVGAEALIRWNRPGHGLVVPGHFIGAAEESGLIRPIGRWVLHEACRQATSWRAAGWTGLKVAVNLSAIQFRHASIRWDVFDALEVSGLPAESLELELTESLLLADGEELSTTLQQWKAAGIQLAIDDFGTGYSSLSYLKRLAVDKIKIDRSFVSNLLEDDQDRCIVKAILQMAQSLHVSTVAEGIECPRVAKQLAQLGCDEGQGYLYAKPMPAAAFIDWLQRQDFKRRAGNA